MAESATKLAVKADEKRQPAAPGPEAFRPFESLRREVERLFDDFGHGFWRQPTTRSLFGGEPFAAGFMARPAVDLVEHEKAYEIAAELPGMDAADVEVTLANGVLQVKGEKREEKEEKKKDYHLSERRYGAFARAFQVPEGVDAEKIEAKFEKGVLKVVLPKRPEAQKPEKKIAVKAG